MKKLLLALLFISLTSAGHSQTPSNYGGEKQPFKAMVLSKFTTVQITLVTLGSSPVSYDIYVDDKKSFTTDLIPSGSRRNLAVMVEMNKRETPEVHKICSVSTGGNAKTKMCTTARLYWM